jgi:hypothetical protein
MNGPRPFPYEKSPGKTGAFFFPKLGQIQKRKVANFSQGYHHAFRNIQTQGKSHA